MKGILLRFLFNIPKNYMTFTMIYHFYLKEQKLKSWIKSKKVESWKLTANLHDTTEYVISIRNSKQALDHGLVLKRYIKWLNLIKNLG